MKKLLPAFACLAALSLTVSGCSATAEPEEEESAASASADSTSEDESETADADAFPVTIDTAFGAVTVEEKPTTVVALGWGDAETALALGVQPVGASDWLAFGGNGVGPWATDLYDEDPEIIETLEPSYEAIAALEPDLILDVKSSGDQERYDKLSQIATTVGIPEGKESFLTSVDEQVTTIAAALGVKEKGEEALDDWAQSFDDVAAEHPEFAGKTVSVGAFTSKGWGAYIEENERVKFLKRLGFVQNPAIEALTPQGFSASFSNEDVAVLDADLIIIFPIGLPQSDVTDQPLFQQIPAVKDGRAIVFETDDVDLRLAYSANTVLSTTYALENLVPLMSDALD